MSGRKLYEIARALPSIAIHLAVNENNSVSISGGEARFTLFGLSSEDFPGVPTYDHLDMVEMEAELLHRMIQCTLFSASAEDSFYHTSGVYMEELEEGGELFLRMVSTDGHRLSLIDTPLEGEGRLNLEQGVVVSKKGVTEIGRLIEGGDKIRFGLGSDAGVVFRDSTLVAVRLLDARFPNYRLVLPGEEPISVELDRRRFLEMLRRMAIMTSDRHKGVQLHLSPDRLTVSLNNPELGEAHETMAIEYRNTELKAAFNPKYLIDALSVMQSEQVRIGFTEERHGCSIRGEADPGFLALIMPMQIEG